ncbi:MAG: OmpA family protein [Ignavibacteriae bacterium]|nr:OmpA family protein [Ignavibacteriota bacterium]
MIQRTVCFVILICSLYSASAQDSLLTRYGIFGHSLVTSHSADFKWLPQTESCCSGFTGGTSIGYGAGFLFESPFAENLLFGARLTYLHQPFSMSTREQIDNIIVNGVGQKGAFEHKLDGSFSSVSIEPTLSYRVLGTLFVSAGVHIGTMVSSNYSQLQQISEPAGIGTFLDENGNDSRKRTRNEYSGNLPNPLTIISPAISTSIELPLNKQRTMLIVPELIYQIGVTNILKDVNWKTNVLRLGFAIKYSSEKAREIPPPVKEEKKAEQPIIIAEIPKKAERSLDTPPTMQISAVGVEPKGIEVLNPILRIEEFTSTIMTPLLNYIFFAPNSSEILSRYTRLDKNQTESFTPEKVNSPDKLNTYYHILNIIGKRMLQKPSSKITLTGCLNDYAEEKGNLSLARNRAERVKSYIMNVWGISPNRIIVKEQLLPSKPSNVMTTGSKRLNLKKKLFYNFS